MEKRKLMKRIVCFAMLLCLITAATMQSAFAAFDDSGLTWDGKPTTLKAVAAKLNYDMVDSNGNYKPLYYDSAKLMWEQGLLQGSDGSVNRDRQLTRTEGVIIVLRLLGKEQEANAQKLHCPFSDVPEWAQQQVAYAAKTG